MLVAFTCRIGIMRVCAQTERGVYLGKAFIFVYGRMDEWRVHSCVCVCARVCMSNTVDIHNRKGDDQIMPIN